MATNGVSTGLTNSFVQEGNKSTQNYEQNIKDMGNFNRASQDAQNKNAMNAIAMDNAKTALNSQISTAKGVSY